MRIALLRTDTTTQMSGLVVHQIWNDRLGATAGLSSSAKNTVGQANRGTRQFGSDGPLVLDGLANF